MPRRVAESRIVLAAVLSGLIAAPTPAMAADPPPHRNADRAHPDAERINQANPRVLHAGPGTPLSGSVFVPPSADKSRKK